MIKKIRDWFKRKSEVKTEEKQLIHSKKDSIQFKNHMHEFKDALEKHIDDGRKYTLIDGFGRFVAMQDLPGSEWDMFGPYVPLVSIIDNESGEIRSFAAMMLIPDLKDKMENENDR